MTIGGGVTLPVMAEAENGAADLVAPATPGAVECKAPGCHNWFVKRSGRHVYCKAPDCTYKRGAPPVTELGEPEGAAEELVRRLQEQEEPEAGPAMYVERTRRIQDALRAGDPEALWGALIDAGLVLVVWADRVRAGELAATMPQAPPRQVRAGHTQKPVGLVYAVLASHKRSVALADRRVDLVYEVAAAREQLLSTEYALKQTQGTPAEQDALAANRAARDRAAQTERALQSVEAAWAERGESLKHLEAAAEAGKGADAAAA